MADSYWKITPGLHNVGSYQVSGRPFASGAVDCTDAVAVNFPVITRWLYIVNKDSTVLRAGFSEIGVSGSNYFTVAASSTSPVLELKVSELWLYGPGNANAEADVVAGLTGIATASCDFSSSSGINPSWSGSAGVG